MKIGFTFTNYNNSNLSLQAVLSILENHGNHDFEIVLVDNASSEEERHILAESSRFSTRCSILWNTKNVGYFDGLNLGIEKLFERATGYDLIVVGNNDLVFDRDFFEILDGEVEIFNKYPVVSPNIITLDNEHQNPHVTSHISRFREVVWDIYFSNYWLSKVIGWLANIARPITGRKDHHRNEKEGPIYQGYGACYLLTPRFFGVYGKLWSPGFVMGEEFYLARQLANRDEKMYYVPRIIVRHHDHATISKLPSRKLWEMTRQSHKIYRFFINPYRLKMDNNKNTEDFNSRNNLQ